MELTAADTTGALILGSLLVVVGVLPVFVELFRTVEVMRTDSTTAPTGCRDGSGEEEAKVTCLYIMSIFTSQ
jgi:hypothetical protein